MKTLATKLTTTSLVALAICVAPSFSQPSDKTEPPAHTQSSGPGGQTTARDQNAQAEPGAQSEQSTPTQSERQAASAEAERRNEAAAQPGQAQPSPSATASAANSPATQSGHLRIATDDMKKHSADKLAGRELRSSDGKEIGKVKEFLIDTRSGEVAYGIISSGGVAGIGENYRRRPQRGLGCAR